MWSTVEPPENKRAEENKEIDEWTDGRGTRMQPPRRQSWGVEGRDPQILGWGVVEGS